MRKKWKEIKGDKTWSIFKIMSEFVEGFEKLSNIGPCISIFGSARTDPNDKYYKYAVEISEKLTERGYGIISGGGPGIMEAANKGAKLAKGKSIGLRINLPFEQFTNEFVDEEYLLKFDYFFVRKLMFQKYSQGFVVMPGGYGTLDELFNALTLIQTKKSKLFPIILVGKKHYEPLFTWIKGTLAENKLISPEDIDLINLVEDKEEVKQILSDFYEKNNIDINFE